MNLNINLMAEADTIKENNLPVTKSRLKADLLKLGLEAGMTVIVHSSMKSLGWVCGKEVTVADALMEVLTPEGTLIMPTHSGEYSDPAAWMNPGVPADWLEIIRAEMPAFRPEITPSRYVGILPEAFRKYPGVLRSNHPCVSFAAWGKHAELITTGHNLAYSLGKSSPLGRIYDLDGSVLMLGTGYDSNTSIHLGESLSGCRKKINCGAPLIESGNRIWKEYIDYEYDSDCFNTLGRDFEDEYTVIKGNIGYAESKLIKQRELVDFSRQWFKIG